MPDSNFVPLDDPRVIDFLKRVDEAHDSRYIALCFEKIRQEYAILFSVLRELTKQHRISRVALKDELIGFRIMDSNINYISLPVSCFNEDLSGDLRLIRTLYARHLGNRFMDASTIEEIAHLAERGLDLCLVHPAIETDMTPILSKMGIYTRGPK